MRIPKVTVRPRKDSFRVFFDGEHAGCVEVTRHGKRLSTEADFQLRSSLHLLSGKRLVQRDRCRRTMDAINKAMEPALERMR